MSKRLELTLLGSPEVRLDGELVTGFRSAKAQALLYYLAMTRRPLARTVLAGLFWGDENDFYARRNLNRTLSNVHQLVGDHLIVTRQTLSFNAGQPYWLDVEALETASAALSTGGAAGVVTDAARLYRGDFLEGFYVHDAPEFEHWVLGERTRLRDGLVQSLLAAAQHQAGQGDLPQAIDTTRWALNLEPWREEAHRLLILFLAQSGQRSAALAQFDACRQILAQELAVEPDLATVELAEQVRTGTFPGNVTRWQSDEVMGMAATLSAIPSPHHPINPSPSQLVTPLPPQNLPNQPTAFVGREAELADITRMLLDEADCRLLALVGPGGIGKTRLALKAAEEILARYPEHGRFADGVFFVPLETVRDAAGIVSAIISVIAGESGFPLHASAPLREQLLEFLRPRAILFLLDNCEHLLKDVEIVSALLAASRGVKILATSREALGLQEAWFYPIAGMSLSPTTTGKTEEIEPDAVRFFVQCARRTHLAFSLEAERESVERICRMVDGSPLAIELAAAWLKALTPQQIVLELERGLDILTARFQNMPVRQRSIRAVMEYSWNLLAVEEREVAQRLSVFLGSFHVEAAAEVAGASLLTLAVLVEKALLHVQPDHRYHMHELTRQYAAERLTGADAAALRDAHAAYYAALLDRQRPHLYTAAYKQMMALVASEFDNVRHAWQWIIAAIGKRREELPVTTLLYQMVEVLATYHLVYPLWLSGLALFSHAVEVMEAAGWGASDEATPASRDQQAILVHIRLHTGLFHFAMGQYRASLAVAEAALGLCRALNLEHDLARALLLYGRTQLRRGAGEAVIAPLQEALALYQRLGSTVGRAEALLTLGMTASNQGRYTQAQTYFQQALTLCQELGYRPWMSRALTNLGTTYTRQHDYERALPYYAQALTIAQEEGAQEQIMIGASNMGSVQRGFGRYSSSVAYYNQSLALARSLHDKRWIAANLNGIAITYLEMGDLTAAERALREALTVAHSNESTPDTLGSIALLGHVLARRGQVETALRALAFVEQHPSVMARDRLYNEPLLAELHTELPATLFDEAVAWAAGHSLDEVVRWLAHNEIKEARGQGIEGREAAMP